MARDNVEINASLNFSGCVSCPVSYNLFDSSGRATGTNTVSGMPSFTGGANPTTYAGYALAAGSPGKANASDGIDRGVRFTAGPPPPPPPPDTTAPDTTIASGPANPTTLTSASFALTS